MSPKDRIEPVSPLYRDYKRQQRLARLLSRGFQLPSGMDESVDLSLLGDGGNPGEGVGNGSSPDSQILEGD